MSYEVHEVIRSFWRLRLQPARTEADVCRCGHERAAHVHYRAGRDCGACSGCRKYRHA